MTFRLFVFSYFLLCRFSTFWLFKGPCSHYFQRALHKFLKITAVIKYVQHATIKDVLKKIRHYLGIFPNMGGGLPNSQNFCILTKYFFECQIHSEVLKHVLRRGGDDIWSILSPKLHLILFIPEKKTWVLGIWEVGGGSPIPKSKCNNIGKILTFWWKPKMFLRA